MTISRRQFVGYAAASGAGLPILTRGPSPSGGASQDSGLITGKPKPLPYEAVKGFLSKEQLRWHHDSHYEGALRGFAQLDADPTGNHRPRVAKANSVLLHELYFENMTGQRTTPGARARAAIKKRFGGVDRWIEDFRAAARSCRGWAVLSYHPVNGKLYNVCSDSHDDGPVWSGIPLVVVDTYEHSYYIDFQNRKTDYVNGFTDHIDWNAIERRVRALG